MPIRCPTACGDWARPARMLSHRRPWQLHHSKPVARGKFWSLLHLSSKPQASSGWERGSRETEKNFFVEKRMGGMMVTGRAPCRFKGQPVRGTGQLLSRGQIKPSAARCSELSREAENPAFHGKTHILKLLATNSAARGFCTRQWSTDRFKPAYGPSCSAPHFQPGKAQRPVPLPLPRAWNPASSQRGIPGI